MKKTVLKAIALVLILTLVLCLASCGKKAAGVVIAVPNDTTNEARALQLLEAQGLITLPSGADVTATVRNIVDNPYNIEFKEVEAAQVPNILPDVDFAVINCNYAIEHKLTPFLSESTEVSYPNIVCVKEGNENSDLTKALVAAFNSQKVQDFILNNYNGAIGCDIEAAGDGYDASVDYSKLAGSKIAIACSPTPHAEIANAAKEVLAAKGIELDVQEYTDYVVPNNVVEDGTVYANYFQHIPYLDDFNASNGTHIVWVTKVHHEPMGIYSDKYDSLDSILNK